MPTAILSGGKSIRIDEASLRILEECSVVLSHTMRASTVNRLRNVLIALFKDGEVSVSHSVEVAVLEFCERVEKRCNRGKVFPMRQQEYHYKSGRRPFKTQYALLSRIMGRKG